MLTCYFIIIIQYLLQKKLKAIGYCKKPERYQCFKQITARMVSAANLILSDVTISDALDR